MDQNKLYNALLKTRAENSRQNENSGGYERPRQEQAQPDRASKPAGKQRAYASRVEIPLVTDTEESHSPSIYDPSNSLGLIENPRPWGVRQLEARKIIYPTMANRKILNAYREIRIKLRSMSDGRNFSVMLTTLSNKTGKNDNPLLPAFNLAASFALDAHSSALLIDCNPYRFDMQDLVSVPIDLGVTDYLFDSNLVPDNIIYPSGVDRLSIVPAGNIEVSTAELFSSKRMGALMEELKHRYPDRYIVINAPPFRVSTEARVLERYADHAVMTVPYGELTAEDVLDSVHSLDATKFAGLIYQD